LRISNCYNDVFARFLILKYAVHWCIKSIKNEKLCIDKKIKLISDYISKIEIA